MSVNKVFIIGAGASKEVNIPTGSELKTNIANLLNMQWDWHAQDKLQSGDYLIAGALREHVRHADGRNGDINPYVHEARNIRDALPLAISIDRFIDTHRDNEKIVLCGKLAIVRSILLNERNSLLYYDQTMGAKLNFSRLEKTWYNPFFQLLAENCRPENITQRLESITLIVFNYDRCVEHFIYNALQYFYRVPAQEAIELVKHINIFHPYGTVGNLPWLGQDATTEFGQEPLPKQLLELSQKIKTYAEGTDPSASEILNIREHMRKANTVVFLGFAFDQLNMELINPSQVDATTSDGIKCFATTYGISASDSNHIKKDISNLYHGSIDVQTANLTCSGLFQEYRRPLSF